ncbi:hypothetical protein [Metabacillus fastidiosus]|uniref:hypothetical protein n=1 Tax=Metabacillus fastidiosus TaxID=1458 RepID=UPI003D2D198C
MAYQIGNGYLGSDSIKSSVAMENIIPNPPDHWSKGYSCYRLSFRNRDDCTVIINNDTENPIFLEANQGFNIDYMDTPIHSFQITANGILYNWLGAY